MTALIIIGAILLFFVLLAFLPLRIRVSYKDQTRVYVPILFFGINLYPRRKKLKSLSAKKYRELNKPKSKKKKRKTKASSPEQTSVENTENKLTLKTIKPHIGEIISQVSALILKFSGHLNVKIYSLWVVVSSDDAAKTAVTYGAVSSSVAILMALLEDNCNIRYSSKATTGVYVDYTLGKCKFECDIRFTLRVWQIISLAVSAAMSFIKTKIKLEVKNNVRKQDQ